MLKYFLAILSLIFYSQSNASGFLVYPHGFSKPGVYIPGSHTYFSSAYTLSEKNLVLLRELKQNITPVRIAGFGSSDPGRTSLVCRASYPIYTPDELPYEGFIEEALKAELAAAGLYSSETGTEIIGNVDAIDFTSFGTGKWTIEATFSIGGKDALKIRHEMAYPVGFGAEAACNDVARALVPAIQEFLYALYADPKFKDLLAR